MDRMDRTIGAALSAPHLLSLPPDNGKGPSLKGNDGRAGVLQGPPLATSWGPERRCWGCRMRRRGARGANNHYHGLCISLLLSHRVTEVGSSSFYDRHRQLRMVW